MDLTNKTQLQTTTAALVGVAAGYAAGQHWLGLDAGAWSTVIGGVIAIGAVLWPAIVTRAGSLKDTVAKMRNTTVVTDAASAAALPDNKDVVAATPELVAAIKKAQ